MEITNSAVQTVGTLQNVLFNETAVDGNCSIIHREGSGLITLRGLTEQCRARYKVTFGANVAIPTGGTVGPISLAIAVNGEPVTSNIMIYTPAAALSYGNISSSIYIDVPKGCCTQISVRNISSTNVLVINANLIADRVA
jgi:hypothetical protein